MIYQQIILPHVINDGSVEPPATSGDG